MIAMELENLVQIIGQSHLAFQSMTQPVDFQKIDSIWWFCSPTRSNALLTNPDLTALEVLSAARAAQIKGEIVIQQFLLPGIDFADLVQRHARQGFELTSTQHLMKFELTPKPDLLSDWRVYRAETMQQVQEISSSAKQVLLTEKHLPPAAFGVRLYAIQTLGQVIAWGRVTQVQAQSVWVSDLFTKPKFRKRGVMTALMRHAQTEALAFGAQEMLLFTEDKNHDFYVRHGFEVIAVKLRFAPRVGILERLLGRVKQRLQKRSKH